MSDATLEPWDGKPLGIEDQLENWHWVADRWGAALVIQWSPVQEEWLLSGDPEGVLPASAARKWVYFGPCAPPAGIAA